MLQVPAGDLGSSLVSEVTMTRGEQIKKERSVDQAGECRDALAKAIYGRLFSWIVNSINQLIQPPDGCGPSVEIGILDIFGFENFTKNSFEQVKNITKDNAEQRMKYCTAALKTLFHYFAAMHQPC